MYRPIRTLGAGGMAKVTLASDEKSGTKVVLKRTLSGSPADERRLRVEGNLGRRLHHKAIVRTLDVYDDEDGRPVVVLEYVPGLSMSALRGAGPLSPALCCVVGQHVGEALHAIHTAVDEVGKPMHMLHRDVTPANILVDLDGQAKLIDLGIARAQGDNLTLTATGEVRGTLRYLAPELFQGDKQSTTTDLWALGIVILEAAIGEPIHKGSTAEIIARILRRTPLTHDVLERLHPALGAILQTLLNTDPAARETDAAVIARAFARVAAQGSADQAALARHVRGVVDDTAAPADDAPDPDDDSWSSLLDARAQLADATTLVAGLADATTRNARDARPNRGLVVGIAAGALGAALAGAIAVAVLKGPHASLPGAAAETTTPPPAPAAPSLLTTAGAPVGAAAAVLLPASALWRYHDTGADPGSRWREAAFDDATWPVGQAKLGYGDDGEVTRLSFGPDPNHKHAAAFFRTRFTVDTALVPPPNTDAMLVARMIHDDGAALYLNGVEILRTGLAPRAAHTDYALQVVQRGRGELRGQVFRLPARALRPGENVLAAEVHQAHGASTDLAFELELTLER